MLPFTASYKKYILHFKKPAGTSRGFLQTKETFFLCLTNPDFPNRIGLGECAPLRGLSVDDRPDFEAHLAQVCHQLNQGTPPAELDLRDYPALAFGLEMALLDWQQGGKQHLFQTDFSLGHSSLPTHGLIWMADSANMLQQVHNKVAQGFKCIKMKIGALDFSEELALIADIRRAYPANQIELRLDANGAFKPETALTCLKVLAPFQIHSLEQPLKADYHLEMAAVCANSPIDIALDESLIGLNTPAQKETLLQTIKPQHIILKPTLLGGFKAAEEWINLAQGLGIGWWVNSALESNIGLNAICQWVSTFDDPKPRFIQGLGTGHLYTNNIPAPICLRGANLIYDLDFVSQQTFPEA